MKKPIGLSHGHLLKTDEGEAEAKPAEAKPQAAAEPKPESKPDAE